MQLRTAEQLTAEYRETVTSQVPLAVARTQGALRFYELKARVESLSDNSDIFWILRAQIGTLEKLGALLPVDREPSSVELLAVARNLFENLVWLKLFLLDPCWGFFFYGQLLKNQQEDLSGMIAKLKDEVELFETLDAQDSTIIDEVYKDIGDVAEPTKEYIAERSKEFNQRKDELDRRARRTFALYAAAATFNGYSYQAHLLRTKVIPHWQEQLDLITRRMDAFKLEIKDQIKIDKYCGKWNWRGEAQRVKMAEQYDFLYRLTSRLLHATPMNIVTEKELLEGEKITLLEYIVVTVHDILEAIERFDFPGKINAIYVEVREENA